MIVVAIVALSAVVLAVLVGLFVGVPALPDSVVSVILTAETYLSAGYQVLNTFVYADVVLALVGLVVAADVLVHGYKLVMWIVKKIPMLSVSD